MTRIVSLYGGPGTGKSTTAADLFAKFKRGVTFHEYGTDEESVQALFHAIEMKLVRDRG